MRLVLALPRQLPLSRFSTIDTDAINGLTGTIVAEASRLCVLPAPIPDSKQKTNGADPRDIFHPSFVTLGLIRAAREYCLGQGIQFSFFLITDQLARILQRVGMEIKSVGPATDHRGLRRPYIHDFKDGYRRMPDKSPLVFDMFQASPAYKYHSRIQFRQPRPSQIRSFI
jgi:N-acyl amino acid synthase of PEP-CTERM/exosortase system